MTTDRNPNAPHRKNKFHFDHPYFANPQVHEAILLHQIGDLSCEGGYVIGEHRQVCYEISYIASGKGVYSIEGKPYPVQEGDIVLNSPGQLHDGVADADDPYRYFYVGFDFAANPDDSLAQIKAFFDLCPYPLARNKPGIETPFVGIFNELLHFTEHSSRMIRAYLYQIIVFAYRSFQRGIASEYAPDKMDEHKRLAYEIVNYIDTHLSRMTDLAVIAKELNYSYSYLSHVFTKELGYKISDYYNRKRFEQALEWLNDGGWSISRIAEKLRYQSVHTFSKAFRKKFGLSPSEYQALSTASKKDQQ